LQEVPAYQTLSNLEVPRIVLWDKSKEIYPIKDRTY